MGQRDPGCAAVGEVKVRCGANSVMRAVLVRQAIVAGMGERPETEDDAANGAGVMRAFDMAFS